MRKSPLPRPANSRRHSLRRILTGSIAAIAALGFTGPSSEAVTLYWDPGLTPLTPSGGLGTWDTITSNWSDLSIDVLWPNGNDTAIFGAVGDVVTVDVGGVNAGTLQFDVTSYIVTGGGITLGGTPTIIVTNAADTATVNSVLTDGGLGLTKNGAGTLVLGGGNGASITGAVSVNTGTLSVTNAGALGTAGAGTTVASGATLHINNVAIGGEALNLTGSGVGGAGALTATGTASVSGAVTLNASGASIGGTGNLTLSTALDAGGTGALAKEGAGSLILPAISTRSGTTAINGGTVSIGNLGALGTGPVDANATGTLETTVGGTYGQTVTLNGGTLSHAIAGTLTLATAGQLNAAANSVINVTQAGPAGKILLNAPGVLTGSGNIQKTGAGTLQFSSANTGYTGALRVSGGQAELQNVQALGTTPAAITVDGTGEVVITNNTWTGAITANGGAISGNSGNSTYSGAIAAGGNFAARARDFNATGTGRTLTLSGPITGAGNLTAQGPTGGTGRVLITGNNSPGWTGALQVDPNTQAVVSVGFGAGAVTSLGSGDLTLNGGRLTLTPSIGTGLATTAGVSGRWITNPTQPNDTFATFWHTQPTLATRIDSALNVPNQATIDPVTGLPGTAGGGLNLPVPQGVGIGAGVAFVDRYAVVYNGLLNISLGGGYTFFVPSDDGSSLFIDGQQVLVNEGGHGFAGGGATSIAVTLGSGLHQVTLKQTNGGTGGGVQFAYQGPDQPTAPAPVGLSPISNMGTVGVTALTNVTGGLTYALANNITVPNQGAATNTILETSGFDTTSAGNMTVGTNGNLVFASATSHSFTQNGAVSLDAGSGLASQNTAVTVPITTTLTAANTTIIGAVTLLGNANLNADATGLLTINGVIDDGAGTFGLTKNGGAGRVVIGGSAANTFGGAFNVAQGLLLLNKTAGVDAIGAGGLNLDTSIATGAAAIDYAVVRLLANEQIADGSTLNVLTHNTVGYGATLDLNGFTETVAGLNLRGSTAFMGRIVMGTGGQLVVNGDINIENNRNAVANTNREALITGVAPSSNALNLFAPGTGTLDLGGATRTITVTSTVTQADTGGTIDSVITNGGIIKAGGQRLVLNGSNPTLGTNSTFAGGVTLNDGVLRGGGIGGQTSSVFGSGTLTINKGLTTVSGGIAAGAATLELRNNAAGVNTNQGGTVGAIFVGQSVNNVVNYGNAVTVAGTVPTFGVDVNNYPQIVTNSAGTTLATLTGSGGELRMGTLTTSAPLQLNVTGGTNYSLAFNGLSLGGALTLNATTGNIRLNNLSGANNIATIGGATGNVIIGGNGAGFSGNVSVAAAGTLRLAPAVGVANNLFGTGTFTTAANPTIGISPVLEGGALTAGTPGGLTARFYQTNAAQNINTTTAFASIPSGVLTVPLLSDGAITNRPPTVTGTSFSNDVVVYTGLLNITTGGNYSFQTFVDDQSQLVIDGMPVISVNTGANGTGIIHSPVSAPIFLSSGRHTITMKVSNQGGAGGLAVLFNGSDSGGVMRPIPSAALESVAPLTNVANSGVNQSIAAAGSLTLDGGGTDLDGGINDLTFAGATGTLNVTNAGGIGFMTVSGSTAVGGNTATLNPTTGGLALLGDVTGGGVITKTGGGVLVLAGAKTFTGTININAGGVQVTNANSLGTTAGATVVASGAVLDLNGTPLGAEPLTLNGTGVANISPAALWNSASGASSASGPITLAANTTVGGLGDISLTGAITGAFNLTKIGPNTLTVTNANNTGTIPVTQGFLRLGGAGAIGANVTNVLMSAGAVLDLAGQSINRPINLNGAGTTNYGSMNSLGSLINTGVSGATVSNNVVLGGAASLGSNSLGTGGDFTISGVISAAQALTKVGGNTVTLTGVNTYTGNTTVNFGRLLFNGGGLIATGNTLTVNPTATVTLDNSATNVNNRLGGTKAVTLVGGNLNIIGNASVATTEALAGSALQANSNHSVVTLTPHAAQSLTLSSTVNMTRANNGTILIRGTNLGNAPGVGVAQVTFGGTAQTIGQFGAAGTRNRALIPWAVMDSSATGDGASFINIGANGVQALNPASEYDVDAITGPNNILLATTTVAAPVGSTLVNSITATGVGGLTIPAGSTLQLDSGAIGANANATLGGGTINAGIAQSNNLRELVAYTSGAGTNLTINSTLATSIPGLNSFGPNASPNIISRAGLTKAGLGTLTLGAQNAFIGSTRLNGGTTVLAGGTNTILMPPVSAPLLGALTSTLNAGNLILNSGATLDLNGNDQRVGGYASNLAAGSSALPGQGGVITNNSTLTDATLFISQGATFTTPASLNASGIVGAKNLNVQRDGGFTLTLTSPNTFTGTTVINGGLTILQDGATLSGTSSITINRAALRIDDSQTIQTLNRIPASTPITLNGGALTFVGRGGGTQNVWSVGTVTIGLGNALFQETMSAIVNANAAGSAQLTVGNLVRGGVGSQVSFNFIQQGNQSVGDNPRHFISLLNGGALPAPGVMLPAWITVGGYNPASAAGGTSGTINNIIANTTDFAQYDPATGLRPVFYTSVLAPGNNVNLGATTTLPVGNTVLNSLRFDGASTLIFGDAGYDTLNLQSGGLLSTLNGSNRNIGITANAGNITAGGLTPAAATELFIYNGAATLTVNARIIDNPNGGTSVISPVFSSGGFGSTITLTGSNTYTGTTYVNGVNLNLNNTVGGLPIPGNLIASGNTSNGSESQNPANQTITFNASNQIAPTATVTLNGGTVLSLNNNSQTLANLVLAADGGSFGNQGPAVQTGTGTLTLTGGVTATTLNQGTTIPVMQGNLALPAGAHSFNVGTYLAAPNQVGLTVNSVLTGAGSLEKDGPGILGIGGVSTAVPGPAININTGAVQFTTNNASVPGSVVTVGAGSTLNAGGFVGTVGALAGTGTVTSTFSGLDQYFGQVNVGSNNISSSFGGLVTGVVTIGKVGTADFSLTNTSSNYSGGTLINAGSMTLAGAGLNTTGTGVVSVNNTGTLLGTGNVNGGLRFNPGSAVNFTLPGVPGPAPINTASGSVASFGPATVNIAGTPGAGTYPLIDYGGAAVSASTLAGLKLGATPGGGFLYGLVHDAAGTSVNLSVETANPSKTWTGSVNGTWDTTTNNFSLYNEGDQVVFTNAGLIKTITGGPRTPQAITVTNSGLCNDYSIANDIGGALAGGLTKNGSGLLRLTGNNTFGGVITVGGGTVRASVSSVSDSLGSGSVSLGNGTTLHLDPVANTATAGITGRYFNQASNASTLANMHFQVPAVTTQTDPGVPNVTWNAGNRPVNGLVGLINGGTWESFGAQWIGKLNITAAGPYSFFTNSDDATRVFIDGVQINNNDGPKGNFETGATTFLNNGLHDIRFEFLQGTGGAQAGLSWQGPGIAKANIPATSLFTAENVANGFADNNILVGNNVSVSGTATIALGGSQFTAVQLGGLTLPAASTLNVTGAAGRQFRAQGTFLNGGTATINSALDVNLGQVTDGGIATTLIKQGGGRLVMDNTNPLATGQSNVLSTGTVLEIRGGKLAVVGQNATTLPLLSTNPLGSASVRLNGGNLSLETKQGAVTFDNAVSVLQNATIEQQAASGVTMTLGSGTNGVAISGGSTLTFDLFGGTRSSGGVQNTAQITGGAALTVAGAMTGTGNLAFRSTQTNMGQYPVYGSATLTANNTIVGTTTLNGGYAFQGVTNPLTVTLNGQGRLSGSTGIVINQAQLTVDDSNTVNTGRILSGTPLTLRAGSLNLLASTGANSGETLGTVTLDSGWNRIILQNQAGAGLTGLLTGGSLVRNNRSAIQFQGGTLGGAATNSSLVKFTSALAGQLLGGGGDPSLASTSTIISVLPYGVGASNPSFNPPTFMPVTYDATNGVRPITTAQTTTLAAAAANANTRDSIAAAAAPVPTANAINTWTLDNSSNAAQTATLTTNPLLFSGTGAGLLLATATNATQGALTIAGTAINFQGAEGNIIVTNTAGLTISSVIQGTNGLTVSGNNNINTNSLQQLSGGTLTLTGANTYTGVTTINGRLIINATTTDTPLGNAANPVQFGGGTLVFNNANTVLAATRTVTMHPNSFGVIDTNGNADTIAGPVTGSGGLVKVGGGRLTLNNSASNYSGPTTVFQGDLTTTTGPQGNILLSGNVSNLNFTQATGGTYLGNISGLGSVTINVTGAGNTVTLGDPNNANAGVNTYAGGTTIASASTTLRGTTSSLVGGIAMLAATDAIVYEQNFNGTASTVVSGAGPVSKLGTGAVTLVNAATYTGATTISAGSLIAATDSLNATAGAFGNASSAVVLGNAATTTNNSSPGLFTGGAVNIGRPVTVANQATSGDYTIGGAVDANSTISGPISFNQNLRVSQVATTLTNALNLTGGLSSANAGAKLINFTGPGKIDVETTGISDGAGTVAVSVTGGITTVAAPSSYTGSTTITGSTLQVNGSGTLGGTSALTINSGGTLLLGGSDRINDSAPVLLAGGTINTGGFSDTLGTLTLMGDSIIDMGNGASLLRFADSQSSTWTGTLNIWNWSGTTYTGGGTDQLYFGNGPGVGLTATQLAQINFFTGPGTGQLSITGAFPVNGFVGSLGEVVPVPEPSSVALAMGLLGLIGWRERRKARQAREMERRNIG